MPLPCPLAGAATLWFICTRRDRLNSKVGAQELWLRMGAVQGTVGLSACVSQSTPTSGIFFLKKLCIHLCTMTLILLSPLISESTTGSEEKMGKWQACQKLPLWQFNWNLGLCIPVPWKDTYHLKKRTVIKKLQVSIIQCTCGLIFLSKVFFIPVAFQLEVIRAFLKTCWCLFDILLIMIYTAKAGFLGFSPIHRESKFSRKWHLRLWLASRTLLWTL